MRFEAELDVVQRVGLGHRHHAGGRDVRSARAVAGGVARVDHRAVVEVPARGQLPRGHAVIGGVGQIDRPRAVQQADAVLFEILLVARVPHTGGDIEAWAELVRDVGEDRLLVIGAGQAGGAGVERQRDAVGIVGAHLLAVGVFLTGEEGAEQPFEALVLLGVQAELLGPLARAEEDIELRLAGRVRGQQRPGYAIDQRGILHFVHAGFGEAGGGDEIDVAQIPVQDRRVVVGFHPVRRSALEDAFERAADRLQRGISQAHRTGVVGIHDLRERLHAQVGGVADAPGQRQAGGQLVVAIAVLGVLAGEVGLIHVAGRALAREARAQAQLAFDQRHVERGAHTGAHGARFLGGIDVHAGAELEAIRIGGLGDVFEQAAHRAGAVQRSLRAAQHFHALDVIRQQIQCIGGRALLVAARADRGVIDVGADDRAAAEGRDTAQCHRGLARCAAAVHLEARHVGGEVVQAGGAERLETFFADHADAGRHLHHVLGTLLCGRHHAIKLHHIGCAAAAIGVGILGHRRGGKAHAAQGDGGGEDRTFHRLAHVAGSPESGTGSGRKNDGRARR
ncbi:hypothetical protein D3C71_1204050 [compost metagenome]